MAQNTSEINIGDVVRFHDDDDKNHEGVVTATRNGCFYTVRTKCFNYDVHYVAIDEVIHTVLKAKQN